MKTSKFLLIASLGFVLGGCYKEEHTWDNKFDLNYSGTRNYTLEFDHVEVVNETETANVNNLLDPVEVAYLNVYLTNTGVDPCMLVSGQFVDEPNVNGFYIYNEEIGTNEGGIEFPGSSTAKGYRVQYIDPGATDYISVKVRTYSTITPNQDVNCKFTLQDDDGQEHIVNWMIHVQ